MLKPINFIGSLVAPIATWWIKDASGSFAGACYLAAAVGVAGAIVLSLIRPAFRWAREASAGAA